MQSMPDMSQLLKLARSPAGQQLISLLQKNGGNELQTAIAQASLGNYEQAKNTLSSLFSDPETKALLKQLEGET